jgi:hypothetical protein
MRLAEEFDAEKFLRRSLELGTVVVKAGSDVFYGIPTPAGEEIYKLLVWHNNDKNAVKKVENTLSSNPQLRVAHEWLAKA